MIAINGFRFNTYTPTQKSRQQPSFEAKAPIDLNYVLKERSHLLPPRILEEVKRIAIEELGMKYAEEGQVIKVEGAKGDYVRQYTDMP